MTMLLFYSFIEEATEAFTIDDEKFKKFGLEITTDLAGQLFRLINLPQQHDNVKIKQMHRLLESAQSMMRVWYYCHNTHELNKSVSLLFFLLSLLTRRQKYIGFNLIFLLFPLVGHIRLTVLAATFSLIIIA